jgi:thiol-disulfide isomerase/thioredoxin
LNLTDRLTDPAMTLLDPTLPPDTAGDLIKEGTDASFMTDVIEASKHQPVIVDFWATWCGPCIASFPKVKALNRYYRGFDVVVVGVTSPQGFVVLKGAHVDTENDVTKEISLINTDFTKEKEVSWPIAVSKQNVFNPDFGITGIPSVAIIDAEGKVRYAGLHPAQPIEEKTKLIDGLLAEAKLPLPAIMMGMKPTEPADK